MRASACSSGIPPRPEPDSPDGFPGGDAAPLRRGRCDLSCPVQPHVAAMRSQEEGVRQALTAGHMVADSGATPALVPVDERTGEPVTGGRAAGRVVTPARTATGDLTCGGAAAGAREPPHAAPFGAAGNRVLSDSERSNPAQRAAGAPGRASSAASGFRRGRPVFAPKLFTGTRPPRSGTAPRPRRRSMRNPAAAPARNAPDSLTPPRPPPTW